MNDHGSDQTRIRRPEEDGCSIMLLAARHGGLGTTYGVVVKNLMCWGRIGPSSIRRMGPQERKSAHATFK